MNKMGKVFTVIESGSIIRAMNKPTKPSPKWASWPILSRCDLIPYIEMRTKYKPFNQLGIETVKSKKPISIPRKSTMSANTTPLIAPEAPTEL